MQIECKMPGNNQAGGDPRNFPTEESWLLHAFCCHMDCQEFPAIIDLMLTDRIYEARHREGVEYRWTPHDGQSSTSSRTNMRDRARPTTSGYAIKGRVRAALKPRRMNSLMPYWVNLSPA